MLTVIYAIVLFCILIFIHELGHFAVAKACGIKVNQFAIGMGPAFLKWQRGETEYSLRAFPIGGFCAMEGEDEESDHPRAFNNKPAWQRAAVVAAGPVMNFALAILLMCIVVYAMGTATTRIGEFVDGSPAVKAGLEVGDRITEINGQKIEEWQDVSGVLSGGKAGDPVSITALRGDEQVDIDTELMESDGRAIIGITPMMERHAGQALATGFKQTFKLTGEMYKAIKQLFTGEVSTKELSGPVGIIYIVNQSVSQGVIYFLYLMAMLSLNLGIINLIPFPALDGGRLIFIIIRKITGQAVTDKMEARINLLGMALLLALMVYVTWNDILKYIFPLFE